VSDDLEMKAISANFAIEEVIVRGANAGVDLFAICHDPALQHRAMDALVKAVRRGDVSPERVADANRRLDALLAKYARPAGNNGGVEHLNSAEHRAVVARIEELEQDGNGADPTRVVG